MDNMPNKAKRIIIRKSFGGSFLSFHIHWRLWTTLKNQMSIISFSNGLMRKSSTVGKKITIVFSVHPTINIYFNKISGRWLNWKHKQHNTQKYRQDDVREGGCTNSLVPAPAPHMNCNTTWPLLLHFAWHSERLQASIAHAWKVWRIKIPFML